MRLLYITIGALLFLITEIDEDKISVVQLLQTDFQTASISGEVTLPPASASSGRQYRGSAYRSRGSDILTGDEGSVSKRYSSTIISAHPSSYKISNLPTADSVYIIQENAEFIPPVTPVTIGSTVHFVNNDSFYHNVFSLTPGAKFNIGRRPTGDIYSKEVPPTKWKVIGLGPIDLFCDIHSQMNAVILSLDTPYFTRVNEDGSYEIDSLPEGTYELRAYSKNMDLQIQKITVAADEQYEVNFNLVK
ncbi:MAG: carboxypeptidase regulatory-like domain-containing protein [Balneolaceae bacterium]